MKLNRITTGRDPTAVTKWLDDMSDWLTVRFAIPDSKAFWRGHYWNAHQSNTSRYGPQPVYEHWLLQSERDALMLAFNIQIPDGQELVYLWWMFHDEFVMYEARYHPPGLPDGVFTNDGGIVFYDDVYAIECSLIVE
jgi:hypothetical protein